MKKLIMFTIVISSLLMAGVFFGCEAGLTSNSGDSESDSGGFSFSDMYKKIDLMQKQIDTLNSSLTLTAEQAYVLNYPHILTNNHCIGITSGSGQISYAGGDFAVILGKKVQLPSFEFTTAASKTYHVRFKPAAGWSLNDLSNGAYNPGGA
ncbi:MAG: hypothetical protein GY754_29610, partial [bacterium]|nr:hypothetical protein [bacterium]